MGKVLLNFRGGFAGLREGFEALGYEVIENLWAPDAVTIEGTALCVADFVDSARQLRRTLGLKKSLARARVFWASMARSNPGLSSARFRCAATSSIKSYGKPYES